MQEQAEVEIKKEDSVSAQEFAFDSQWCNAQNTLNEVRYNQIYTCESLFLLYYREQ